MQFRDMTTNDQGQFGIWKSYLLLGGLGLLTLLYQAAYALYNLYLHPLSKYPGPKLAIMSEFYYQLKFPKGDLVHWTHEMHKKYGDIVRLGPDRLSFINSQAWKDIYGHRFGDRLSCQKDMKWYAPEVNGEYNIITTADDAAHARIRKIFTHGFSDKALRLQEPLIKGYVDQLVSYIQQAIATDPNTEFDMVHLYNCTTFDVMGDLTFGESLGLLDQSEYIPWIRAVFDGAKHANLLRIGRRYPLIGRVVRLLMPRHLINQRRLHFNNSMERVNRRLERGNNKPDFWNLVLKKGEDTLSNPQMHANASFFMLAGTETTSTLLSGLAYYLLTNPEAAKKATQEVRSLSSESELNLEVLPRLKYLNACFEEALRCYPPVPVGLPRVVPKGGTVICGEMIPESTSVSVSQYATYRSTRNFKDPDSFIPERWLPDSGFDSDDRHALQPFSFGPRNCLGKNLAYHEMRLIMSKMLWNFDFQLSPRSADWGNQNTYTLWEKPPLLVKAKAVR